MAIDLIKIGLKISDVCNYKTNHVINSEHNTMYKQYVHIYKM